VFFEIFEKKIQGLPRSLSPIQWGRGGKSGRVFEILEKKFKDSCEHLARFSGGGVENQAECFKFWRKNSKVPAGT